MYLENVVSFHASESSPKVNARMSDTADTKASPNENTSDAPNSETQGIAHKVNGPRWIVIVIGILLLTFLYALDNTKVANVRPSIIASLGQIEKLPWVSVAYAVGEVGSNPFW